MGGLIDVWKNWPGHAAQSMVVNGLCSTQRLGTCGMTQGPLLGPLLLWECGWLENS